MNEMSKIGRAEPRDLEGLRIDRHFVARLLLGALSESEQRRLAVLLLRRDTVFRAAVVERLEPFEMFDVDLVGALAEVLQDGQEVGRRRRELLARAGERETDLESLLRDFTYDDALALGPVSRRFFTWTMAEHLLERSRRAELPDAQRRTSLYLALMVIDVIEILGAAGHSPTFPEVVRDVRQRILRAAEKRRQKA